jgi:hypothetical protein
MKHRWCRHEVGQGERTEDNAEQHQQNGLLDDPK